MKSISGFPVSARNDNDYTPSRVSFASFAALREAAFNALTITEIASLKHRFAMTCAFSRL